jgi:hypothetical protein
MVIQKGRKHTKGAAPFLDKGRHVPAADLKIRIEEREAREAADTRTEAQRWLGDPPAARSALATHTAAKPR